MHPHPLPAAGLHSPAAAPTAPHTPAPAPDPSAAPSPSARAPRSPWVDTAKGLSIILVVILHTSLWLRQAGMERIEVVSTLNLAFEDLRMPLFFAMSGLFAGRWLTAAWPRLLAGKVQLLAWVFLLWQVPMLAYRILGGQLLPGMVETGLPQQLATLAWSPLRSNAELWFLWALAVFFLAGRALRRVPTPALLLGATVLSVVWSGVLWQGVGDLTPGDLRHLLGTGAYTAPAYFLFFIGAARCRDLVRGAVARLPRAVWAGVVGLWFLLFVHLDVLDGYRDLIGVEFLGQVCGAVAGIGLAVCLQWIPALARPLAHLGRHTLEVYLTHTTTVVAVCCGLYLLAGTGGPDLLSEPWRLVTLAAASAVAVAVGLGLGRAVRATPRLGWLLEPPSLPDRRGA